MLRQYIVFVLVMDVSLLRKIEIRCLAGSEISIQQAGGFCIGNFASKGRDAHESKGF